jgi:hypothetical protein
MKRNILNIVASVVVVVGGAAGLSGQRVTESEGEGGCQDLCVSTCVGTNAAALCSAQQEDCHLVLTCGAINAQPCTSTQQLIMCVPYGS